MDATLLGRIVGLRPAMLIGITLVAGPLLLLLPAQSPLRRWVAKKTVGLINRKAQAESQGATQTPSKRAVSGSRTA